MAGNGRLAWGLFVGAIALLALHGGTSSAPRDDDLDFVRTLLQVKQIVGERYVEEVEPELLRRAAVQGMLAFATDPYTVYVPPAQQRQFQNALEGRFEGIGVLIESVARADETFDPATDGSRGLRVISVFDNGPAEQAGVRVGDVIVSVDGDSILGTSQAEAIKKILGPVGTEVELTLERGDDSLIVTARRDEVRSPPIEGHRVDERGTPVFLLDPPADVELDEQNQRPQIAYVRLRDFTPQSGEMIATLVGDLVADGLDGMILDLRGNPGGGLGEAAEIADLFLDEGTIVWWEGAHSPRNVRTATPGSIRTETGKPLPLAVLIDGQSASASEILAGALGDHDRATLVGTRSYGKGSVQSVLDLGEGSQMKITTDYFHLPNGRLIQKKPDATVWGVDPDIVVEPDGPLPAEIADHPAVRHAERVVLATLAADAQN